MPSRRNDIEVRAGLTLDTSKAERKFNKFLNVAGKEITVPLGIDANVTKTSSVRLKRASNFNMGDPVPKSLKNVDKTISEYSDIAVNWCVALRDTVEFASKEYETVKREFMDAYKKSYGKKLSDEQIGALVTPIMDRFKEIASEVETLGNEVAGLKESAVMLEKSAKSFNNLKDGDKNFSEIGTRVVIGAKEAAGKIQTTMENLSSVQQQLDTVVVDLFKQVDNAYRSTKSDSLREIFNKRVMPGRLKSEFVNSINGWQLTVKDGVDTSEEISKAINNAANEASKNLIRLNRAKILTKAFSQLSVGYQNKVSSSPEESRAIDNAVKTVVREADGFKENLFKSMGDALGNISSDDIDIGRNVTKAKLAKRLKETYSLAELEYMSSWTSGEIVNIQNMMSGTLDGVSEEYKNSVGVFFNAISDMLFRSAKDISLTAPQFIKALEDLNKALNGTISAGINPHISLSGNTTSDRLNSDIAKNANVLANFLAFFNRLKNSGVRGIPGESDRFDPLISTLEGLIEAERYAATTGSSDVSQDLKRELLRAGGFSVGGRSLLNQAIGYMNGIDSSDVEGMNTSVKNLVSTVNIANNLIRKGVFSEDKKDEAIRYVGSILTGTGSNGGVIDYSKNANSNGFYVIKYNAGDGSGAGFYESLAEASGEGRGEYIDIKKLAKINKDGKSVLGAMMDTEERNLEQYKAMDKFLNSRKLESDLGVLTTEATNANAGYLLSDKFIKGVQLNVKEELARVNSFINDESLFVPDEDDIMLRFASGKNRSVYKLKKDAREWIDENSTEEDLSNIKQRLRLAYASGYKEHLEALNAIGVESFSAYDTTFTAGAVNGAIRQSQTVIDMLKTADQMVNEISKFGSVDMFRKSVEGADDILSRLADILTYIRGYNSSMRASPDRILGFDRRDTAILYGNPTDQFIGVGGKSDRKPLLAYQNLGQMAYGENDKDKALDDLGQRLSKLEDDLGHIGEERDELSRKIKYAEGLNAATEGKYNVSSADEYARLNELDKKASYLESEIASVKSKIAVVEAAGESNSRMAVAAQGYTNAMTSLMAMAADTYVDEGKYTDMVIKGAEEAMSGFKVVDNWKYHLVNGLDSYVVFDVETTGKEDNAELLQISAIKYDLTGKKIDEYYGEVKPSDLKMVNEEVSELNHITRKMAKTFKLGQAEAAREFAEFSQGSFLVGHNVGFDVGRINYALSPTDMQLENPTIDTSALFRKLNPDAKDATLATAVATYKVKNENAHDARADVAATNEVFRNLIDKARADTGQDFSANPYLLPFRIYNPQHEYEQFEGAINGRQDSERTVDDLKLSQGIIKEVEDFSERMSDHLGSVMATGKQIFGNVAEGQQLEYSKMTGMFMDVTQSNKVSLNSGVGEVVRAISTEMNKYQHNEGAIGMSKVRMQEMLTRAIAGTNGEPSDMIKSMFSEDFIKSAFLLNQDDKLSVRDLSEARVVIVSILNTLIEAANGMKGNELQTPSSTSYRVAMAMGSLAERISGSNIATHIRTGDSETSIANSIVSAVKSVGGELFEALSTGKGLPGNYGNDVLKASYMKRGADSFSGKTPSGKTGKAIIQGALKKSSDISYGDAVSEYISGQIRDGFNKAVEQYRSERKTTYSNVSDAADLLINELADSVEPDSKLNVIKRNATIIGNLISGTSEEIGGPMKAFLDDMEAISKTSAGKKVKGLSYAIRKGVDGGIANRLSSLEKENAEVSMIKELADLVGIGGQTDALLDYMNGVKEFDIPKLKSAEELAAAAKDGKSSITEIDANLKQYIGEAVTIITQLGSDLDEARRTLYEISKITGKSVSGLLGHIEQTYKELQLSKNQKIIKGTIGSTDIRSSDFNEAYMPADVKSVYDGSKEEYLTSILMNMKDAARDSARQIAEESKAKSDDAAKEAERDDDLLLSMIRDMGRKEDAEKKEAESASDAASSVDKLSESVNRLSHESADASAAVTAAATTTTEAAASVDNAVVTVTEVPASHPPAPPEPPDNITPPKSLISSITDQYTPVIEPAIENVNEVIQASVDNIVDNVVKDAEEAASSVESGSKTKVKVKRAAIINDSLSEAFNTYMQKAADINAESFNKDEGKRGRYEWGGSDRQNVFKTANGLGENNWVLEKITVSDVLTKGYDNLVEQTEDLAIAAENRRGAIEKMSKIISSNGDVFNSNGIKGIQDIAGLKEKDRVKLEQDLIKNGVKASEIFNIVKEYSDSTRRIQDITKTIDNRGTAYFRNIETNATASISMSRLKNADGSDYTSFLSAVNSTKVTLDYAGLNKYRQDLDNLNTSFGTTKKVLDSMGDMPFMSKDGEGNTITGTLRETASYQEVLRAINESIREIEKFDKTGGSYRDTLNMVSEMTERRDLVESHISSMQKSMELLGNAEKEISNMDRKISDAQAHPNSYTADSQAYVTAMTNARDQLVGARDSLLDDFNKEGLFNPANINNLNAAMSTSKILFEEASKDFGDYSNAVSDAEKKVVSLERAQALLSKMDRVLAAGLGQSGLSKAITENLLADNGLYQQIQEAMQGYKDLGEGVTSGQVNIPSLGKSMAFTPDSFKAFVDKQSKAFDMAVDESKYIEKYDKDLNDTVLNFTRIRDSYMTMSTRNGELFGSMGADTDIGSNLNTITYVIDTLTNLRNAYHTSAQDAALFKDVVAKTMQALGVEGADMGEFINDLINKGKEASNFLNASREDANAYQKAISTAKGEFKERYSNVISLKKSGEEGYLENDQYEAVSDAYLEIIKMNRMIEGFQSGTGEFAKWDINTFIQNFADSKNRVDELTRSLYDQVNAQKAVEMAAKGVSSSYAQTGKYQSLMTKAQKDLTSWTSAKNGQSSWYYNDIQKQMLSMQEAYGVFAQSSRTPEDIARFNLALQKSAAYIKEDEAAIRSYGENMKSFGERSLAAIRKFSSWLSITRIVMRSVMYVKQLVKASIELDDAITKLKVVTNEPDSTYIDFMDKIAEASKRAASGVADMISSVTTYARLGYNTEESSVMAELTAMLQNVGNINVGDAQNAITAIVKAYGVGVDDLESIMDKLVIVGNNAPISVSEIATGMNNASSSLSVAGNSIEESIALLTAANTTVQDISKASTGLRTIVARIRNTKTDLDELGETMSTAEYNKIVSSLTDNGVSLVDRTTGNLRSTYDVIKDIASVAKELKENDPNKYAALAETLSGTRQQNIFYSLVENFGEASKAMDLMADSEGSLKDANDEVLTSTASHMKQFKAAVSELGYDMIPKESLNGIIDLGTRLIDLLDRLASDSFPALKISALAFGTALTTSMAPRVFKSIKGIGEAVVGFVGKIGSIPGTVTSSINTFRANGFRNTINSAIKGEETEAAVLANRALGEKIEKERLSRASNAKASIIANATGNKAPDVANVAEKEAENVAREKSIVLTNSETEAKSRLILANDADASSMEAVTGVKEIENAEKEKSIVLTNSEGAAVEGLLGVKMADLSEEEQAIVVKEFGNDLTAESIVIKSSEGVIIGVVTAEKELEKEATEKLAAAQVASKVAMLGFIAATVAAIALIKFIASQIDTAREKFDKYSEKLDETEKSMGEVTSRLEEIKERVEEINGMNNISIVEDEELEKLNNEKLILEQTLAMLKEKQKIEAREKNEALDEMFNGTGTKGSANDRTVYVGRDNVVTNPDGVRLDERYIKFLELYGVSNSGMNSLKDAPNQIVLEGGSNITLTQADYVKASAAGYEFATRQLHDFVSNVKDINNMTDDELLRYKALQDNVERERENVVLLYDTVKSDYFDKYVGDDNPYQIYLDMLSKLIVGEGSYYKDRVKETSAFGSLSNKASAGTLTLEDVQAALVTAHGTTSDLQRVMSEAGWSAEELLGVIMSIVDAERDAEEVAESFSSKLKNISDTSKGFKQLGDIMSDIANDGGRIDLSKIVDDDFVKEFSSLDSYDAFINTVASYPDDINKVTQAVSDLASEYIYSSGALNNLDEETKLATINMLRQMGVSNAASIVEKELAVNKHMASLQADGLADAEYSEMLNKIRTTDATEEEIFAMLRLAKAKYMAKGTISTVGEVDSIMAIAEAAGIAADELEAAKSAIESGDKASANNILKNFFKDIDSSSLKVSIGDSSQKKQRDVYDIFSMTKMDLAKEANRYGDEIRDAVNVYNQAITKGVDLSKTTYGNVDLNARKIMEWNEFTRQKFSDAIESFGLDPESEKLADKTKVMTSTFNGIFGGNVSGTHSWIDQSNISDLKKASVNYRTSAGEASQAAKYGGVKIAFTPVIDMNNESYMLAQDQIDWYLTTLIDKATNKKTGKLDVAKLLELDSVGMAVTEAIKGPAEQVEVRSHLSSNPWVNMANLPQTKKDSLNYKNSGVETWTEVVSKEQQVVIDDAYATQFMDIVKVGPYVKNIIAGVGDSAEEIADVMQYAGDNGKIVSSIKEVAKAYGLAEDKALDYEKVLSRISSSWKAGFNSNVIDNLDALNEIYQDVKDGKEFDYDRLFGDDTFNRFGKLESYDDFINTIASNPRNIKACAAAFNKLSDEIIFNSGYLENLTEDNKQYAIEALRQKGITNAQAIVDRELAIQKRALAMASGEYANATASEIIEMMKMLDASDLEFAALSRLLQEKLLTNATHIDTSGDIDNLLALCDAAGATISVLNNLKIAKALLDKAANVSDSTVMNSAYIDMIPGMSAADKQKLKDQYVVQYKKELIDQANLYINSALKGFNSSNFSGGSAANGGSAAFGGSPYSGSSGSGSGNGDNWFERQLKEHKHLVAMDQETQAEYLAWLNEAYQRAYKEGIITLDDYYSYAEEVFEGIRALVKDGIDDINHEISMRQNYETENAEIIKLYKDMIARVEKELKAAREYGLSDEDEYVQELQDMWWEYTNSLKDLETDVTDSAKDALDDLVEYRMDMLKQEVESEKDAMNDKLDALKDFYDEQKKMLQDQYDEEKYLEEQNEKRKSVSDIQNQLNQLSKDNSAWAQKRIVELTKELEDAQKELDDFEKSHALDMANDAIDGAYDSTEKLLNKQIEALEDSIDDPERLYNKALSDIKTNTEALYAEMLEYNRRHGTGNDEDIKDQYEEDFKALLTYLNTFGEHYKDVILKNATGYKPNEGLSEGWNSEVISGYNPANKPAPAPAPSTPSSGSTSTSGSSTSSSTSTSTSNPYGKVSALTYTLNKGASGDGVKRLQYALKQLGYNVGPIDGVFGSQTYNAVVAFQKAMGEIQDGSVGPKTRAAFAKKGYASGTANATPGIHPVDELGAEYLFTSGNGSKYRVFSGGEKVLNAKATNFLYDFANSGGNVIGNLINNIKDAFGFGSIKSGGTIAQVKMGDIIINGNASEHTVSEIRRAQRENVNYMLKQFNKLKA